jgi:hypothetical protein
MNLPTSFAYPAAPLARRHGPAGYQEYQRYKPFLRDEFEFRCAYCLERETWYPNRDASFGVDHFELKSTSPHRELDYENLMYACNRCNSIKFASNIDVNPTLTALGVHLRVLDDGQIEGLTPAGKKLIDLLHLADTPAIEVREETLLVLRAKRAQPCDPTIHAIFLKRFRYPPELPDLMRLDPPGNSRPGGIDDGHHARLKRGELPEFY